MAKKPSTEVTVQKKPGPVSKLTDVLIEEICDLIKIGESLNEICKREGFPHLSTVTRWLGADDEFATKYARAREVQADFLEGDMARIENEVEDGSLDPAAARVILDSKRWRASKLRPKVYGDKQQVDMTSRAFVIHSEF
jgi:hypothetical protein